MTDSERLAQIAAGFEDLQRRAEAQRAERKTHPDALFKSTVPDNALTIGLDGEAPIVVEWHDLAALFRSAALNTEPARAND